MTLDRDAILNAKDRAIESVPVPEWGGDVLIRTMTGRERDALEVRLYGVNATKENIRANFVAAAVVKDDGALMFTADDVEALGDKAAKPLDRIWRAVRKQNGIGEEEVAELAKNSEPGPSGGSGSR